MHQYLESKNNQYDQVIIIDDNQEVIKELTTFCKKRKLPVNAFHYFASVPQKHEQIRVDYIYNDNNSSKESITTEQLYQFYPTLKKERKTYDYMKMDLFKEDNISTTNL